MSYILALFGLLTAAAFAYLWRQERGTSSYYYQQFTTADTDLKKLQATLAKANERLSTLPIITEQRDRLAARIEGITSLEDEISTLERQIDQLRSLQLPAAQAEAEAAYLRRIADLKNEMSNLESEIERLRTVKLPEAQNDIEDLRRAYATKRQILETLLAEISAVEERSTFAEMGVYEPHFDFSDSESYRREIEKTRDNLKSMIKNDQAVLCATSWSVGTSAREGERMIKRQKTLTLRAFNGESDAAIANTRWNNFDSMEARIHRSRDAINKANTSLQITLANQYVSLKLKELRLVHEHREKQREEKEALREQQRAQREEDELQRRATEAEREERRYQTMLDKAKQEAERTNRTEEMRTRIEELQKLVDEAAQEKERAKAMAEMTKCGYVYIISNVGSFGEGVVKIGLTRRLEPEDRIRELSGASVPFSFDVHAMIYSEAAPDLERTLHREFDTARINIANPRKEFFRCEVDTIEKVVRKVAPDAHFVRDVASQEWLHTVEMRKERLASPIPPQSALPISI